MKEEKKILGEDRRNLILTWLQERNEPITGAELASNTNVSRQVIVQDISLLKARNEPIIATSQGYLYIRQQSERPVHQRVIACKHTPEQTFEELCLIVDHGVFVKDVVIEHPVYGDLTASIRVSNRTEVEQFIHRINETNAVYLSQLTNNGIHLHTLEADSISKLDAACYSLHKAGILVES